MEKIDENKGKCHMSYPIRKSRAIHNFFSVVAYLTGGGSSTLLNHVCNPPPSRQAFNALAHRGIEGLRQKACDGCL